MTIGVTLPMHADTVYQNLSDGPTEIFSIENLQLAQHMGNRRALMAAGHGIDANVTSIQCSGQM